MAMKLGKTGKQKNHSSSKKTFAKTGKGKLTMEKAARNHLLLQKARPEGGTQDLVLSKGDSKRASKMLPSW